jgi:predicted flap endonuclease-1-like 5' DNA nuclease
MLATSAESWSRPFNQLAAERLREAANLLAHQDDNAFRVAAYRKAADAVESSNTDLRVLLERDGVESLERIPGIGKRIAGNLAELARTGRWTYLERLRGSAEPHDIFCTLPGVGPILAKRLHEMLHAETLEQLEAALLDKSAGAIAGIGSRRLAMLRAGLNQMLSRIRSRRLAPTEEPSVAMLLDVDREYRQKAAANQLKKIAPRRLNPRGEAWLPILHTDRDGWHFTALFSNTARAHQLGKVDDWVVIYFHEEGGGEAQRTIVTETQGPLAGRRIVRGRERDCFPIYEQTR